ncbi:hypothetical protein [Breoghania sp.]|uniref:hypothetical protein n=1 Tax=Breoghania sp. TaxID=2065378 RepID=UPI002616A205|nr:hypothetical protein [Breoghania sp.]MDJ0932631.1 hypothetical protein [Breoghania sp.]
MLAPGSDNIAFRCETEAAGEILGGLTTGLQIVRDQWIGPVLGSSAEKAHLCMALFRRSGNSLVMMRAAVQCLSDYLAVLDVAPLLEKEFVWIGDSLQFELSSVLNSFGELKEPLTTTLRKREAYDNLAFVDLVLHNVRESASEELAVALKIQVGFNALDVD